MKSNTVVPYAPVILKLLQNPLYSDESSYWNVLLSNLTPVQEYFARIGLEVRLYEEDGYAFLHQPALEDDEGQVLALPRLTRRDRLTYHVTLLCALLREWLDHYETAHLDASRCLITADQLHEMMLPFLPERTDERALQRKIDGAIGRLCDLGFLKQITASEPPVYYEVRRILKAKFDAEKLAEIKERLAHYGATES